MAKFNPIKTVRSKVDGITVTEGNFIFCTDTGEIFIDSSYGASSLKRRQGFPKHTRPPVDLIIEAGTQSGLDMMGDVNDPIQDKTIVFVKEVESYFYFDAASTATPDGETVVKPEYITTGPGRWHGFTTNGITPTIGANGNWFLGTVDTGKPSRGATPQIINKYWHIDGVNTNIKAEGVDGNSPVVTIDQDTKMWKIDGVSTGVKAEGADGVTPTLAINSSNKHWIINGVDSGIKAEGEDGDQFEIINDYWYINGTNTNILARAQNGRDGTIVTIDPTSKNWRLDGADTGVKAEGIDGIGLNFRGAFNASASPAYGKNGSISDTVTYNGAMWAYVNATASNNAPPDTGESNDYWVQIPISAAGEGGGIPVIDGLDYNPERKDALMIITPDSASSGQYLLLDTSKTGTARIWQKYVSSDNVHRLYYQYQSWNGKHCWIIIGGSIIEEYGEFWSDPGYGTSWQHISDTLIDDPTEIEGSWTKMQEGMEYGSGVVTINKLPDSAENFGLKSFGTKDKPLEHGNLCQVLSENCIYKFDSLSYAAEDGIAIVRPTYILPDGPGRWIKSMLFPSTPDSLNNMVPTKRVVSMVKYVDADVYVPFHDKYIENHGTKRFQYGVHKSNTEDNPEFVHSPFGWALKNGGLEVVCESYPPFTIEFWVMFDGDSDWDFLDNNYWNFGIAKRNGKICLEFKAHYQGTFETLTNPVHVFPNEWYHVAYVVDDESRLYVNGVGCSSSTKRPLHTPLKFTPGYSASNYYLSDFAVYRNRAKYTEDFYPDKLPLYKQVYDAYIPQDIPEYMEDFFTNVNLQYNTYLKNKERVINPGCNYFQINTTHGASRFTCTGFGQEEYKAILLLEATGSGSYPPYITDAINDFTGDNAPTSNQINVYEIQLVDFFKSYRFIIKKLGAYPKTGYVIYDGSYTQTQIYVNNPRTLSSFDHYYTIDGFVINHPYYDRNLDQIFAGRHVAGECGKLIASSLMDLTASEARANYTDSALYSFSPMISGDSFRSGWRRLFINWGLDQYNTIQIGIHKGRLLFFYNKSNMQQIETNVIFKQMCGVGVTVPGDYGDIINGVIYCISQDCKLYTMSATRTGDEYGPLSYEASELTLLDDTRTWKCFTTNFGGGFSWNDKPVAIADKKIVVIDPTDNNTVTEVDAADADNIIVSGLSSGSGTYVPNGTNVWVTGTANEQGKYPYYLMAGTVGSYNGKWIISNVDSFEGMEEYEIYDHILASSTETTATSPTKCTWWVGGMYGGGPDTNVSVLPGNAKWDMITTVNLDDNGTWTIAISTEGKPYYLKYVNDSLVSTPLRDENSADITTTGWFVKHNVDGTRLFNKASKKLYNLYKRSGEPEPYINLTNSNARVENVVDYHANHNRNWYVAEMQ